MYLSKRYYMIQIIIWFTTANYLICSNFIAYKPPPLLTGRVESRIIKSLIYGWLHNIAHNFPKMGGGGIYEYNQFFQRMQVKNHVQNALKHVRKIKTYLTPLSQPLTSYQEADHSFSPYCRCQKTRRWIFHIKQNLFHHMSMYRVSRKKSLYFSFANFLTCNALRILILGFIGQPFLLAVQNCPRF